MKTRTAILYLVSLALFGSPAFGRSPQGAAKQDGESSAKPAPETRPAAPKIDPVKEANIRKLLEMTGASTIGTQMMDNMQKNLRQFMTASLPPGDYRDKLIDLFAEKFKSKADAKLLVDSTVQIYDKFLSDEDIKGLIQFYSTPLGKKMVGVLPQLSTEAQTVASQWGQNIGQQSMLEVLAEHPDLAKALEDASKGARQQ